MHVSDLSFQLISRRTDRDWSIFFQSGKDRRMIGTQFDTNIPGFGGKMEKRAFDCTLYPKGVWNQIYK